MKVVPLGAGQDVGRSCVLVSLGGTYCFLLTYFLSFFAPG